MTKLEETIVKILSAIEAVYVDGSKLCASIIGKIGENKITVKLNNKKLPYKGICEAQMAIGASKTVIGFELRHDCRHINVGIYIFNDGKTIVDFGNIKFDGSEEFNTKVQNELNGIKQKMAKELEENWCL